MRRNGIRKLVAALFAVLVIGPSPAFADCEGTFGDLNSDAAVDVSDVQCAILSALSVLEGSAEAPACVASASLEDADLDCSGKADIVDVLFSIQIALAIPLDAKVDANQNGCPDVCDAADDCVNGQTSTSVGCGLNGNGSETATCVAGDWGDLGPCVDPDVCVNGTTDSKSCGLNGNGTETATCVAGDWGDLGPCVDPDECVNGATDAALCGFNDNGTKTRTCVDGQWGDFGGCADPDVCVNGATDSKSCGLNGNGAETRTCVEGQWGDYGSCEDPVECVIGTACDADGDPCTFNDSCVDGACAPGIQLQCEGTPPLPPSQTAGAVCADLDALTIEAQQAVGLGVHCHLATEVINTEGLMSRPDYPMDGGQYQGGGELEDPIFGASVRRISGNQPGGNIMALFSHIKTTAANGKWADYVRVKYPVGTYWNVDGTLMQVRSYRNNALPKNNDFRPSNRNYILDGGYAYVNGQALSERDGMTGKAIVDSEGIAPLTSALSLPQHIPYEPLLNVSSASNFEWSLDPDTPRRQYALWTEKDHVGIVEIERNSTVSGASDKTSANKALVREVDLPFQYLISGKNSVAFPHGYAPKPTPVGKYSYMALIGSPWSGAQATTLEEGGDLWVYVVNLDYDESDPACPGPVVAAMNLSQNHGVQTSDDSGEPNTNSLRFSHDGRHIAILYKTSTSDGFSFRILDVEEEAYTLDPAGTGTPATSSAAVVSGPLNIVSHDFSYFPGPFNGDPTLGHMPFVPQHPAFAESRRWTDQAHYGGIVKRPDQYFVGGSPDSKIGAIGRWHGRIAGTGEGEIDGVRPLATSEGRLGRMTAVNLTASHHVDSPRPTDWLKKFFTLSHPGGDHEDKGEEWYEAYPSYVVGNQRTQPDNAFDAAYVYVAYGGTGGGLHRNEIVAFNIDNPDTGMVRVTHTRTSLAANYEQSPAIHVSPDGTKLLFNSSWTGMGTLGGVGYPNVPADCSASQEICPCSEPNECSAQLYIIDLVQAGLVVHPLLASE